MIGAKIKVAISAGFALEKEPDTISVKVAAAK
jgi:hypothetical protein